MISSFIDTSPLGEASCRGRSPSPALFRVHLCKNILCLPSLTELFTELIKHPAFSAKCGFDPNKPIPSGESPLLIPYLKEIISVFNLNPDNQINALIGDSAYDSIHNFEFVFKELKAKLPRSQTLSPGSSSLYCWLRNGLKRDLRRC